MNQVADSETSWRTLYKIGGIAPLITLVLYMSQFLIFLSGEAYPTSLEEWFTLFQRSKILGLFFLNSLDIVSVSLLGIMFLAVYIALKRYNASYMVVAAFFAFLGIAVFVSSRANITFGTLTLTDQYTAATTEAQRSQIVAAGLALHSTTDATPKTMGFLFIAVAGLIISIVVLRSEVFSKIVAYVGIVASVLTFADDVSLIVAPSLADILMPVSGLLWVIWWLLISLGLLKLGRDASKA